MAVAVGGGHEGYGLVVECGRKKARMPWGRLIGNSIVAGFWVAIAGHCSTFSAAAFYIEDTVLSKALSKVVYALVFPIAFLLITLTHAELFTGNTMAMIMYAADGIKKHLKAGSNPAKLITWMPVADLLLNWSVVIVFNYIGATLGAFILSIWSGTFLPEGPAELYIGLICKDKVIHSFQTTFFKAVGCNILVCCASFATISVIDMPGKIMSIWALISAFVLGGFEHSIANFYTLTVCGAKSIVPWSAVFLKNFMPVIIGNTVGGVFFCGGAWAYLMAPYETHTKEPKDHDHAKNAHGNFYEPNAPKQLSRSAVVSCTMRDESMEGRNI